jgi:hypothetical protein
MKITNAKKARKAANPTTAFGWAKLIVMPISGIGFGGNSLESFLL